MVVEFTLKERGQQILVNVRPSSFSVTIDVSSIYTFDTLGRLLGAYYDGRNYLRGLDNRVLVKWGAGHGLANRSRRDLSEGEKRAFFTAMQESLRKIEQALQAREITLSDPATADALAAAGHAVSRVWGYDALHADGERFRTIYRPISILPPDQYLALVLQATEGCSWNKCTFCNFYKDRPFHIKNNEELRRHIQAVKAFFGEALALRKSVFLADANALIIPQERLLELLDIVNAELPIVPARLKGEERRRWLAEHPQALRGIYSFVDAFTIRHKDAADYRQLAERNLRRVYIGLESGDDTLLDFLNKGSRAKDAQEAVTAIKAGGVDVGVILMLGVGGRRFADDHVRNSVEVVNAMNLGECDIIYFSPFFDYPQSEYAQRAAALEVQPLTGQEMDAQMAAIRAGLRFADPQHPPKIAIYDIREFIY